MIKGDITKIKKPQIYFNVFQVYVYDLGDVIGSVEAILDVLETYESKQCKLDIIHYGIGNVSVTDIEYADAFKGKFNHNLFRNEN